MWRDKAPVCGADDDDDDDADDHDDDDDVMQSLYITNHHMPPWLPKTQLEQIKICSALITWKVLYFYGYNFESSLYSPGTSKNGREGILHSLT